MGETVYDPFGGSGSTLIACEHTKRKCLMVELDPGYCQTIINRWEKLTMQRNQNMKPVLFFLLRLNSFYYSPV